eukprot:192508-Amphidinium_carterae.1
MVIGEMKQRNDPREEKRFVLPEHEKMSRLNKLHESKPGVQTGGDYEPSSRLVDKVYTGVRSLNLPTITWSTCTSKREEMRGLNRTSLTSERVEWRAGQGGIVHERLADEEVETDLSTDLRASLALHRRGVAMHVAGAMDFDSHQALLNK